MLTEDRSSSYGMAYWKLHQLNEKLHRGKPRGNVSNSGTRGPLTTENLETTWTYGHVSPQEKRHAQKLLGFLHLSCSAKNCPGLWRSVHSTWHSPKPLQAMRSSASFDFPCRWLHPGHWKSREFVASEAWEPWEPGDANQISQLNTNPIDPKQWGKWGLVEDLCPKSLPFQVKLPFFWAQKEKIPEEALQFASSLGSRSKSAVGFFQSGAQGLANLQVGDGLYHPSSMRNSG